jgi:hypothetical protein
MVSLRGRSWRGVYEGGDARAIANVVVVCKRENGDCRIQERGEIDSRELLGVEEGTRYYLNKWMGEGGAGMGS